MSSSVSPPAATPTPPAGAPGSEPPDQATVSADPLIGTTLGAYRILAPLGRGGMGTVYRAEHVTLQRPVAVKVLSPRLSTDPIAADRFIREARTAASITHAHVVTIHDADSEGGVSYIAMELVEGESVGRLLARCQRLEPTEAIAIAKAMALALAAAHAKGLVHRDLKPENILLPEGAGAPKLSDFGLARAVSAVGDRGLTREGEVLGTPGFMAPEQCDDGASVDHRSDLYALGATLFAMLSGRPPVVGATPLEVILKQLSEPAPALRTIARDVPEPVARVVDRLLLADPDARYQSAEQVFGALDAAERIATRAPTALVATAPALPPIPAGAATAEPQKPKAKNAKPKQAKPKTAKPKKAKPARETREPAETASPRPAPRRSFLLAGALATAFLVPVGLVVFALALRRVPGPTPTVVRGSPIDDGLAATDPTDEPSPEIVGGPAGPMPEPDEEPVAVPPVVPPAAPPEPLRGFDGRRQSLEALVDYVVGRVGEGDLDGARAAVAGFLEKLADLPGRRGPLGPGRDKSPADKIDGLVRAVDGIALMLARAESRLIEKAAREEPAHIFLAADDEWIPAAELRLVAPAGEGGPTTARFEVTDRRAPDDAPPRSFTLGELAPFFLEELAHDAEGGAAFGEDDRRSAALIYAVATGRFLCADEVMARAARPGRRGGWQKALFELLPSDWRDRERRARDLAEQAEATHAASDLDGERVAVLALHELRGTDVASAIRPALDMRHHWFVASLQERWAGSLPELFRGEAAAPSEGRLRVSYDLDRREELDDWVADPDDATVRADWDDGAILLASGKGVAWPVAFAAAPVRIEVEIAPDSDGGSGALIALFEPGSELGNQVGVAVGFEPRRALMRSVQMTETGPFHHVPPDGGRLEIVIRRDRVRARLAADRDWLIDDPVDRWWEGPRILGIYASSGAVRIERITVEGSAEPVWARSKVGRLGAASTDPLVLPDSVRNAPALDGLPRGQGRSRPPR